jgi:hypothetical protein
MKLLTSVFPRGSKVLPGGGWFTLAVVGAVVGLEVLGRYTASDLHDGLAAFALLAVGLSVVVRHRREPLPWVRAVAGWCRRAAGSAAWLRYDHGIDLRGEPPLPRRTPPVVWVIALGLVLWGGLAALAWDAFPAGWRTVGVLTSYTVYLVGLLLLWAALLACTFVGVFVPVAVLDRRLKGWVGDTDRRGAELAAVVGYAVLVSAIAWVVPPYVVLLACLAVAVGAWVMYLPRGRDGAAVLWRSGVNQPIYAVPLHRVLAVVTGLVALVIFDLLLTACGGRLFGPPPADDAMPVTALLGAMAAWLLPGLLIIGGMRLVSAWRNDPARRTTPVAHVTGGDRPAQALAARTIRGWGWKARVAPAGTEGGGIGIELVGAEQSEATEFDPRWPLKVSAEDLASGGVRDRLARRDEIYLRRQFFRGLAKLFRRASAFKGPNGGGFWLAPHWWFIEGLGREDADANADENPATPLVGPPYTRVLTPRCRQHVHAALRATQVDMIFVEDGVGYRKVEKVLRVLMELYDVHAGRRKAEELHFRGLPKVRVMIHDYEPGNPFRSDVYPEPKFDDLSRVRVLHVFRDRGGHEERVEPPFDFSWTPAPALTGG